MAADAIVTDMGKLKDLEPLAAQLNPSSDELTKALEAIQQRLNELALGVEAWLDNTPDELAHEIDWPDPDNDSRRTWRSHELGYGRHGDGWALLVRTMDYPQFISGSGEWEFEADGSYELERKPLLRSARALRVEAVGRIPTLVDALRDKAEQVINAVEQAKKLARTL